ncbi:MAG: hypothetical protein Q9M75_07595 [Ghiorsea sp.]|nr:hypothetical protein [Ghiorsea sp.]MDQ6980515.1 hypothetical protein [Ghiorsea sp.]MDQ7057168.1 hypothetical protein [Ghiorsea sp.]
MKDFIINIPYTILIGAAILMALMPFQPEPHLVQKFDMLVAGNLTRPLDMFDVLWHFLPTILLITKFILSKKEG